MHKASACPAAHPVMPVGSPRRAFDDDRPNLAQTQRELDVACQDHACRVHHTRVACAVLPRVNTVQLGQEVCSMVYCPDPG